MRRPESKILKSAQLGLPSLRWQCEWAVGAHDAVDAKESNWHTWHRVNYEGDWPIRVFFRPTKTRMSVQNQKQRISCLARQRESPAGGLRIFWMSCDTTSSLSHHVGIRSSSLAERPNNGLNVVTVFLASSGNHRTDHELRGGSAGPGSLSAQFTLLHYHHAKSSTSTSGEGVRKGYQDM